MAKVDHTLTMNERAAAEPPQSSGTRLGRYTLLDRLGEGGMGVVYTAYDAELDRRVALKFLREDRRVHDQARVRFLREARTLAQVAHRNVVTVFDVGTIDGKDFIAMEYVDGPTLRQWLATPHSIDEIVSVFRRAGRGLAAAHARGLVHRDFKPANVLLTQGGEVRVTDFGLAVESATSIANADTLSGDEIESVEQTLSEAGAVMGTPAYMAPEQHHRGVVDERTDQFAFGVALYEAIYHQRPFAGDDLASLKEAVLAGRVRPAPKEIEAPARVKKVIERALKTDPAERFPSMKALLAELAPPARPRRRLAVVIASLVVIAAIVFSVMNSKKSVAVLCDDAGSELDEAWSVVDQAALRLRFGAVDKQFAGRVADALDAYATDWRSSATLLCQARYVQKRINEEEALLQRQCLAEREQALRSTVDGLLRMPTSGFEKALSTVRALPPVSDCADLGALREGIRPPADPTVRLRVGELRQNLADARIKYRLGDYRQSEEQCQEIVRQAAALDYAPLGAEANLELGIVRRLSRQNQAARQAIHEAELLAEESHHQLIRARALVELLELDTLFSIKHDRALETARRARAAAANSSEAVKLNAFIDRALARVSREQQKREESRQLLERAVAGFREGGSAVESELSAALVELGTTLHALGRDAEALESFKEALKIQRDSIPGDRSWFEVRLTIPDEAELAAELARDVDPADDHPSLANILEDMAHVEEVQGNAERSAALYRQATTIWERPRGRAYLDGSASRPPVAPGRRVAGRVLDSAGLPVAGANVVLGRRVVMGPRSVERTYEYSSEINFGVQRTVTNERGQFAFDRVIIGEVHVIAEHPDLGRSRMAAVRDPGTVNLSLPLAPFGRLQGSITGLASAYHSVVFASDGIGSLFSGSIVFARPDGTFAFDRLAAGDYKLFLQVGHGFRPLRLLSVPARVSPGSTTTVVLDASRMQSGVEVSLDVVETHGVPIGFVGALLILGRVEAKNGAELNEEIARMRSDADMLNVQTPMPLVFSNVQPGIYSVCAIALREDAKDPDAIRRAEQDPKKLPVFCKTVTVPTAPLQVQIDVTLPPEAGK